MNGVFRMKRMFLIFVSMFVLSVFITGCVSSGYKDFYKPYNQNALTQAKSDSNFEFLKDGEEPKVFTSSDLAQDIKILRRKRLVPIGYSSFNGAMGSEEEVITQAKRIGAVVAIYSWKYTNTQQNSGVLMLPNTNYSTTNMYGSYGGNMFSGTAYTQSSGTQMVPYSNTQRRYDQEAVYFIKSLHKLKFGLSYIDIKREKRIEIGKNGVIIDLIFENTPSSKSNLLEGDIIIKLDEINIENPEQFDKLLTDYDISKGSANFTVIRNKEEKQIKVMF